MHELSAMSGLGAKLEEGQKDFDTLQMRSLRIAGRARCSEPAGTAASHAVASSSLAKTSRTAWPPVSVNGLTFPAMTYPSRVHCT